MECLALKAPAKINLYLEICGREHGGHHLLETILQTVNLHDMIHMQVGRPGINLRCPDAASGSDAIPAGADNLAVRAAAAWYAESGLKPGIDLVLEKRIPAGAGLGGGSSDAAAVLRGLQTLHGEPLSPDALEALARSLGADVPFFLAGGCAYATGRGDRIEPIADPPVAEVTLLLPACRCPTAAVFTALTEVERQGRPRGRAALETALRRDPAGLLFNRLAAAARRSHPPVDTLLRWLEKRNLPHCLTGSGSACLVWGHLRETPPGCQVWRLRSPA